MRCKELPIGQLIRILQAAAPRKSAVTSTSRRPGEETQPGSVRVFLLPTFSAIGNLASHWTSWTVSAFRHPRACKLTRHLGSPHLIPGGRPHLIIWPRDSPAAQQNTWPFATLPQGRIQAPTCLSLHEARIGESKYPGSSSEDRLSTLLLLRSKRESPAPACFHNSN